jgi:glycosyltransferase involved in cell wall biosynthesis
MDVGVLSSDSESFSNALVEYMAAGLAGVATDVGGAREAVDGGVGRVVPPGDAQALGRAVADLLQDPRELARARFRNPPHVAGLFSLERFVQAHERIYRELAALRRLNAA